VIAQLRKAYRRWSEDRAIRRLFKHGVPIRVRKTDEAEYR
jgi:hypothetical protein